MNLQMKTKKVHYTTIPVIRAKSERAKRAAEIAAESKFAKRYPLPLPEFLIRLPMIATLRSQYQPSPLSPLRGHS